MTARTFGKLFKRERRKAEKTLGEVARHLGVSISFVADVEHDRRNPFKHEQIMAAAEFFGIAPMPLFMAAAQTRGSVTVSPTDPDRLDVAASLARSIDELTPQQLAKIRAVLDEGDD